IALGDRRPDLWNVANLDLLAADGRAGILTGLADLVRDDPQARALVSRWLADPASLSRNQCRLAGLVALARLRASDPGESADLWDPAVMLALLRAEDLDGREAVVERLTRAAEIPFQRNFALLGASPDAASQARWPGWVRV